MKKVKILLIALILVLGGVFFSNTFAANIERNLGAQMERPFTSKTYQYGVDGETSGIKLYYTAVKIFDDDNKESNTLLYSTPFYCLRGGVGFGASTTNPSEDVSKSAIKYIQSETSEMHENASEVIAKYQDLYGVDLNRTETINGTDVNIYNAILWVLDESYLPKDIEKEVDGNVKTVYDAFKYKTELLDKAGVPTGKTEEDNQENDITDDDLEVIQQLAIWYFANYDEQTAGTNPTVSQSTMNPAQFLSINENNNIDSTRADNLDRIYQYLVYGAIDNAGTYVIDSEGKRSKPAETNRFDDTSVLTMVPVNIPGIVDGERVSEGPNSFYKIGPFKIQSANTRLEEKTVDATSIVLYDANNSPIDKDFIIDNTRSLVYEFVEKVYEQGGDYEDESGEYNLYLAKQLEKGKEYYIVFRKAFEKGSTLLSISEDNQYDITEVTLGITSSYSLSTATFLYASENSGANQAVVELQKEKISDPDSITTQKPKEFDMVLRKFIYSINGNQLTGAYSRVPKIDLSKLNTTINTRAGSEIEKITTARYVHPKNPLLVEKGDTVVYTLRIYNEGQLDGTATEIIDYLPLGLELVPYTEGDNSINDIYGWEHDVANKIKTNYLQDTTIKAYDPTKTELNEGETGWQKADQGDGGLYYADIQIECRVKDSATDQSLRNIAEITMDKDANGNDVEDRDSPNNIFKDAYYTPGEEDNGYFPGEEDDDDFENLVLKTESFDLALRKNIIEVKTSENTVLQILPRIPQPEIQPLTIGQTTADYNHRKHPVEVETGSIVTYRFSVYNEGDIDGYVNSIIDYLPVGLDFDAESNPNFIEYKETYEADELTGKQYAYKIEGNRIEILPLNAEHLFELAAFDGTLNNDNYIDVKFKVTASQSNDDQVLTNVATMTYEAKDTDLRDRDSNISGEEFNVPTAEKLLEGLPGYIGNEDNDDDLTNSDYHYKGQQDDDDFEKIIIKGKPFDLSLRKFITSIKRNGEEVEVDDRTPVINTETLINGTFDRNGTKEYTATYEHSKEPLVVKQGDIITYTLRIYNEGERDGYATEITDYIPEGLALILNYNTNFNVGWELPKDPENIANLNIMNLVGEDGFYKTEEDIKNFKLEDFKNTTSLNEVQLVTGKVNITTNMLDDQLLKAFDKTLTEETAGEGWQKAETGESGLYYKDIQVSCLVIAKNTCPDELTNIAEISDDKDEFGNDVIDDDSKPKNKKDPYKTSQEDDDDYEPVVLRCFDLALRKFITGVETNGKLTEITSRVPNLSIDEETGNIKYTHPKDKEPVAVANNDVVIYTLRVYNEGTVAGYAEEITDDIPEGLIFLPEHDVNKEYEWKMFDKDGNITDKSDEAQTIKTKYLSEEKQTDTRKNLIAPFDSSEELSAENPDCRDIKVAFRVMEPNTSDRIIENCAQISEDSGDDEDSDPHEWREKDDDQDKEYIYVKKFDLSLLKWVTQTIVTVDGKTTTTETGFKPNKGLTETPEIRDNKESEPVAKVEIDKNKLNKTTVKFAYKIKVTNEGEVAGYATEITDFIPKGLEFKAEDNKKYGWVKEGDDKVTTRALETVLLKPGESAELEIVFTWINDKNNFDVKTNIAEITDDSDENGNPGKDIDSDPDNKKDPYEKEQEDDDDFALVVLSLKTGKGASYTLLITAVITMLAGGIYLIKKYVLTY